MKRCVSVVVVLLSFFMAADVLCDPVSLVWQVDRRSIFETEWIKELLAGIDLVDIDDGNFETMIENSIVVVAWNRKRNFDEYFERLHEKGIKFGVIHISDESYEAPTFFYPYAAFVFRNYWHKQFAQQENVVTFPLGYSREFFQEGEKNIQDVFERRYFWSFIGQIVEKPTREAMIENMFEVPNYFLHETYAWGRFDKNALSPAVCRQFLLNTVFVPCPAGWWNLDSFRICEALECGCIPIVEKMPLDYFTLFLGEHPFIAVDSWSEAPAILYQLLADPEALEARRKRCYEWWVDYKTKLNKKLVDIVRSSFS